MSKLRIESPFNLKLDYSLKYLTLDAMKLLGIKKIKTNVPKLEITEAILVHCNPNNNDYQQNSRVL